jgi:hypothetical protein
MWMFGLAFMDSKTSSIITVKKKSLIGQRKALSMTIRMEMSDKKILPFL